MHDLARRVLEEHDAPELEALMAGIGVRGVEGELLSSGRTEVHHA